MELFDEAIRSLSRYALLACFSGARARIRRDRSGIMSVNQGEIASKQPT